MKKTLLVSLMAGLTALGGLMYLSVNAQETTQVSLTVTGGSITIGQSGDLNLGSVNVSSSDQTLEKQFTGDAYFWVEDLIGSDDGYYTTLSVTNLSGVNTTAYIPSTNVYVKVDSTGAVLINGQDNPNVVVGNGDSLLTYSNFDSPITFINRAAGTNDGKVGKYAAYPRIRVVVPAYQQIDQYVGTITYTLYY